MLQRHRILHTGVVLRRSCAGEHVLLDEIAQGNEFEKFLLDLTSFVVVGWRTTFTSVNDGDVVADAGQLEREQGKNFVGENLGGCAPHRGGGIFFHFFTIAANNVAANSVAARSCCIDPHRIRSGVRSGPQNRPEPGAQHPAVYKLCALDNCEEEIVREDIGGESLQIAVRAAPVRGVRRNFFSGRRFC